jgi:PAS domain S-box-containing protein
VFVVTYLIVYAINRVKPFRVPPEAELIGLNIYEHGASTDLIDFFDVMDEQAQSGDLSLRSPVEPFTEVGQIANRYNQLMDSLEASETELRSYQGHLEELVDERTSALNESEARMGAILETASDGVVTMDGEGRVLLWNPVASELFGYDRAEMLGKPLTVVIPERYRQRHAAGFGRLAAGGDARLIGSSVELTGLHRDGHEFPIELSLGTWERGGERFFSGIIRDISERKVAQAELEATNEELDAARELADAANEAKSSFLANMSHELRTPMNAILGYSEMLTEDAEDDGLDDMVADLNKINAAGKHLLSLINDVLDLSKIEAGRMDLFLETFDLHQTLDEVATTAQPLFGTNDNQFVLDVDDQVGTVHLDLTKVRQSLLNLLSNAAKFTNDGTITLSVRAIERNTVPWIEMAVTDTGIGIPADKLGMVFEEFSQADESTTRDFGGTGLGLALTRQLCEMMGGGIELRSEVGVGSTFTIALPATAEETALPLPGQSEDESTPDPSIDQTAHIGSILVIDDDPTARHLLQRILEADGHTVLVASTTEEGLDIARTAQPALITLDLLMPGIDGWSALRALKADEATQDIPVIVVSMMADRKTGISLGAIDALSKPIDRDRLLHLVHNYVTSPDHTILIVEDDEAARSVIERTLTDAGYSVLAAADGAEGLDMVRDHHIDLILLDLMMPVMDGFSFVAELRQDEEHATIPVIVVTAKDLTTEDLGRLEGAVETIVAKGTNLEEQLLAQIRKRMPPSTAA